MQDGAQVVVAAAEGGKPGRGGCDVWKQGGRGGLHPLVLGSDEVCGAARDDYRELSTVPASVGRCDLPTAQLNTPSCRRAGALARHAAQVTTGSALGPKRTFNPGTTDNALHSLQICVWLGCGCLASRSFETRTWPLTSIRISPHIASVACKASQSGRASHQSPRPAFLLVNKRTTLRQAAIQRSGHDGICRQLRNHPCSLTTANTGRAKWNALLLAGLPVRSASTLAATYSNRSGR